MPFVNVKVAGVELEKAQTAKIQEGITSLMAEILNKKASLTAVLVEQAAIAGWTIGAEPVPSAAQVDAIVSTGTNTPEEKARFIAEASRLLHEVLGPDLPEVTYVVVHEVPQDSWGYGGLTQEHRAKARAAA